MTIIPLKPAPIACILSLEDFRQRAQWLRELTARSLQRHQLDGVVLQLVYPAAAYADVAELVRREQACCGFLDFALERGGEEITVTVTAPANASDDAHLLFVHLLPAGPA